MVNFPPGEIKGTEAASRIGIAVTAGEADAADLDVALGIVRGAGVALGSSNRPRRCAGVGKGDAEGTGVEVAAGVGDGSDGITLRGVIFVSGVDVAAAVGAGVGVADIVADGNGVAVTDADEVGVSAP